MVKHRLLNSSAQKRWSPLVAVPRQKVSKGQDEAETAEGPLTFSRVVSKVNTSAYLASYLTAVCSLHT